MRTFATFYSDKISNLNYIRGISERETKRLHTVTGNKSDVARDQVGKLEMTHIMTKSLQ